MPDTPVQYEFDFNSLKENSRPNLSDEAKLVFTVPTYSNDIYTVWTLRCTGVVKMETCRSFEHAMSEYLGQLRAMTQKTDISQGGRHSGACHIVWALLVRRDEAKGSIIYTMDSGENLCGTH